MSQPRVWFSRASSSLHPLLRSLQEAPAEARLHLLVSHPQWDAPAMCGADEPFLEPDDLKGDDYVDWCLATCLERNVQVLISGRARPEISARRAEFAAIGTQVICAADADTLRVMEEKPVFLGSIHPEVAEVSRFIKVNNLAEFQAAVELLRAEGVTVCFKPGKSIFGLGFYVLNDHITPLSRLLDGQPNIISFDEACDVLGRQPDFRDVMVMAYLDGVEYSVDCVARTGELRCAIVRMKPRPSLSGETSQTVGPNPEIEAIARRLTKQFHLEGLFNMQFRTSAEDSRPKLLEINGRMSGGLALACHAGINLLELAIRQALGQEDEVARLLSTPLKTVRVQQGFSAFLPAANAALNPSAVPSP